MDWTAVIRELGFPAAAFAGLAYAIWQVGKFLAPHLSGFFTKHIELVDSLRTSTEKQTDLLEGQAVQFKIHGDTLAHHGKTLEEHGGLIREIHEHVRRVKQ
jgi:hypothetical protein